MTKSTFISNRVGVQRGFLAVAAVLATATFAPSAGAADQPLAPCEGLDCPGLALQVPATSSQTATLTPDALKTVQLSGFYDVGSAGPEQTRVVAYVAAAGQWDAAPPEIKALADNALSATDRASRKIVVYGPGALTVSETPATAATSDTVTPMSYDDCASGWFCVWDGGSGSGSGDRAQWQSVGVWQGMGGFVNRASSMRNNRSAWSLLKRSDGANYCAQPISRDDSLSNNGFNNNTASTYNSSSQTQSSGWSCAN